MPFKSEAQRRYLFAKHPDIAHRWAKEGERARRRGGQYAGDDRGVRRAGRDARGIREATRPRKAR